MMDKVEGSGGRGFLGLPDAGRSGADGYFHIIPVPYDVTSTYMRGSGMGPAAIIDASAYLELYDQEFGMEPASAGVCTHQDLEIFPSDPERMLGEIERAVGEVSAASKIPVILGGEHTVSLGAVRALARGNGFTVVSLDAHADLRDAYQGSRYSHACFLRRALELVECRVLGVRSLSSEEAAYAEETGLNIVFADRIASEGVDGLDLDSIPGDVYLSLDLDVLDPSIMPATGTPEPGGLGWYQTVEILRRIISGRRVLGFDVVELCPQPGNPAPDFTAAKLIYKTMGLIINSSKNRREDWIGHGKEKVREETTS
jgi:agmatinase